MEQTRFADTGLKRFNQILTLIMTFIVQKIVIVGRSNKLENSFMIVISIYIWTSFSNDTTISR